MISLKAPNGCNEVVHGDDVYKVVDGVVTLPEYIAHELLTKGAHGFKPAPEQPKTEPRKVYAMKK